MVRSRCDKGGGPRVGDSGGSDEVGEGGYAYRVLARCRSVPDRLSYEYLERHVLTTPFFRPFELFARLCGAHEVTRIQVLLAHGWIGVLAPTRCTRLIFIFRFSLL